MRICIRIYRNAQSKPVANHVAGETGRGRLLPTCFCFSGCDKNRNQACASRTRTSPNANSRYGRPRRRDLDNCARARAIAGRSEAESVLAGCQRTQVSARPAEGSREHRSAPQLRTRETTFSSTVGDQKKSNASADNSKSIGRTSDEISAGQSKPASRSRSLSGIFVAAPRRQSAH